ncbi:MAG: helix-turn-helix domain-containing protein [Hungatella sp.]|jgi:transcriptional regulator with XRE-family HTH domain|nr:helix-turn-helix domain-containing protein [Hungatella sp.]
MYEIFQKLLNAKGETAYKVAKDTGISTATLTQWKNGTSTPKADKMQKIAEHFKVSLEYLMGNRFIDEMGYIIREERIKHGLSLEELARESKISVDDLKAYEDDEEPIREDIFEDIAGVFGKQHLELLQEYDVYDEYIPPYFNGDVLQYEAFKKARDSDAIAENAENEDVLLISRLAKDMKPENRKKLIEMAKIMFAEDFND